MCVCVCVCVCARARVRACVCVLMCQGLVMYSVNVSFPGQTHFLAALRVRLAPLNRFKPSSKIFY